MHDARPYARSGTLSFWFNLIGYQLVWLSAMMGAQQGIGWPAMVLAMTFFLAQCARSDQRLVDMKLAGVALCCGLVIDGGLSAIGWLDYAAADGLVPLLTAPLWILALWLAFSTTLCRSFGALRGRPLLAVLLGAIGGPLAYVGAERGWHAVSFAEPIWQGVVALGLLWALALLLLVTLAARWSRRVPVAFVPVVALHGAGS